MSEIIKKNKKQPNKITFGCFFCKLTFFILINNVY